MMACIISWEQEKDTSKLSKIRERNSRDIDHVKCIKCNNQKVLLKDIDINERWREYSSKLLNKDSI